MPPSGQYNVFELSTNTPVNLSASTSNAVAIISPTTGSGGAVKVANEAAANNQTDAATNTPLQHIISGTAFIYYPVYNYLYNGASWDRQRSPNTFKTFSAVASSSCTVVWTPTAGKKFRLMGFIIGNSSTGDVLLQDSTGLVSGTPTTIFRIPGGANVTPAPLASPPLGNGILSASTTNVLSVTAATTTATLSGTVWGTEE